MIVENWDGSYSRNKAYVDGRVEMVLPNLLFETELYFADEGIRLIHSPGHTADSITVIDEIDGVANAGDNIGDTMDKIVPELDCERAIYAQTLQKYRELPCDTWVSGHNKVLGKQVVEDIYNGLYLS